MYLWFINLVVLLYTWPYPYICRAWGWKYAILLMDDTYQTMYQMNVTWYSFVKILKGKYLTIYSHESSGKDYGDQSVLGLVKLR